MNPWKAKTWLVLDTETTGLNAGPDRIVEVGAILRPHGAARETFAALVNPGIPIPKAAGDVHGIRDVDVLHAPPIGQIAPKLLELIGRADVLVGYNWPFDARFFAAELGEAWTSAIAGKPIIDPLVVVRFDSIGRYWKGSGRHKLSAVATRLGVPINGRAHGALVDCEMTLGILELLSRHLPDDAGEVSAMLRIERNRQDADHRAWQARQQAQNEGRQAR